MALQWSFKTFLSSSDSRDEHRATELINFWFISSMLSSQRYDILTQYVFNDPFCHAARRYVACQHPFPLAVHLFFDVAVPDTENDASSAKIHYERPGAVPWSLFPYQENWKLFKKCSTRRRCFSHSSSQWENCTMASRTHLFLDIAFTLSCFESTQWILLNFLRTYSSC